MLGSGRDAGTGSRAALANLSAATGDVTAAPVPPRLPELAEGAWQHPNPKGTGRRWVRGKILPDLKALNFFTMQLPAGSGEQSLQGGFIVLTRLPLKQTLPYTIRSLSTSGINGKGITKLPVMLSGYLLTRKVLDKINRNPES